MAKSSKADEAYDEKEALERMNKALKKAMESKPQPQKEMARGRKAGRGKAKR